MKTNIIKSDIIFSGEVIVSDPTVNAYVIVTDKLCERFGLPKFDERDGDDVITNIYADYNPFTREVTVCVVHCNEAIEPALNDEEKAAVLEALEAYCKEETGQSLFDISRECEINGFYVCNEAYYAEHIKEMVPEIMIGRYAFENGCAFEFCLEFGSTAPRIMVFNDAWRAFSEMTEFFSLFASLHGKNISQNEVVAELIKLGYTDLTERERPSRDFSGCKDSPAKSLSIDGRLVE